jgi:Holliday junction resolvase RusA-like endonuclease
MVGIYTRDLGDCWYAFSFAIPFDPNLSKNRSKGVRRTGKGQRMYIKPEHRSAMEMAQAASSIAYDQAKIVIPKNKKIFIDIHVIKPSERFDAANVIDGLLDAIAKGIKIDDRWFSGSWDWTVEPDSPRIEVVISSCVRPKAIPEGSG